MSDRLANSIESILVCDSGNPCRYQNVIDDLQQQIDVLKDQAQTDALTGLYNYRYFSDALPREMERAQRSFQPVSLIVLDIDHFKKLNDQWGHEVGNRVLVHLAKIIRQVIRKLDIACRFGGEEFVIILPNTDLRHSINVAQRIREMIEQSDLNIDGNCISITASLGVDEYRSHHSDSAKSFVERVDAWLYKAKHSGRNQVVHPPLMDQSIPTTVTQDEKAALFSTFSYPETDEH